MKNFKYILLPVLSISLIFIFSFINIKDSFFPALTAETLDEKKISIPLNTKGKYSLIGIAYSQKSQSALESWMQPIYDTFIAKPTQPVLFDDSYDIHLYLVLMFTGSNEGLAGQAKKKLNQELDKELQAHVLLYKGDIALYKEELSLTESDKPYFFILDANGEIIHSVSGAYTDAKMEKIEDLIEG